MGYFPAAQFVDTFNTLYTVKGRILFVPIPAVTLTFIHYGKTHKMAVGGRPGYRTLDLLAAVLTTELISHLQVVVRRS